MIKKLLILFKKVINFQRQLHDANILRSSTLFNKGWYLANNLDVAKAEVDPVIHYLNFGGFESRDPGPNFSSSWYLGAYPDVKTAGINPLVHYLRNGKKEGRKIQPHQNKEEISHFQCPICQRQFNNFFPLNPSYKENQKKFGYPYSSDDAETLNVDQYQCPNCHASDRERLYALYFSRVMKDLPLDTSFSLLDIAPSRPLKDFLLKFPNIKYLSADKYMQGVDIIADIMNMITIQSGSFDAFICSHVLEHVGDDKKALSELFRILKPSGFGILMVPINLNVNKIDEDPGIKDAGERWRRFGQEDHVRLYSKRGFIQRVEDTGFIVKQYGIDYFDEDIFLKHGITFKSVLYIVEKP
jgi:SAM-dependent methyltransferase